MGGADARCVEGVRVDFWSLVRAEGGSVEGRVGRVGRPREEVDGRRASGFEIGRRELDGGAARMVERAVREIEHE
jgi:hypothetical protein